MHFLKIITGVTRLSCIKKMLSLVLFCLQMLLVGEVLSVECLNNTVDILNMKLLSHWRKWEQLCQVIKTCWFQVSLRAHSGPYSVFNEDLNVINK